MSGNHKRREAYRLKRRKAARPPKRRAPEVGLEGTAGAVSGQRDGVPFPATAQTEDLAVQASLNDGAGSEARKQAAREAATEYQA